jgi:chaperonin cofactor prefoldin
LSKSIEDLDLKGNELKNKMESISKFEESFKNKVTSMIHEEISKNNVISLLLNN